MEQEPIEHKLLILIINYNNSLDTICCLKSVMDSDADEPPFCVIIDNSDSGSEIQNELDFYPHIKILKPGGNTGFARGINFGFRWAIKNIAFKYLLILNNDTILKNDSLAKLFREAESYPGYSVFSPCILTYDPRHLIWYAGGHICNLKVTPVINQIGAEYSEGMLHGGETQFASGCAIMFRRSYIENKEYLFDPFFFMYDEDADMCIGMLRRKESIWFVSDAIVYHKCQGSQNKGDTLKPINQLSPGNPNLIFYLENTIPNRYYIIDKHYTGVKRILIFLSVTLYWLVKSVQYLLFLNFRGVNTILRAILLRIFKGVNRNKMT